MRNTMIVLAATAALAVLSHAALAAQPNVVVIIGDDIGCESKGCTVNWPGIPTPNLKALAKAGMTFKSGYATAPVCDPSRVSMLLGRYSQRAPTGIWSNPDRHSTFYAIPTETTTIGEAMKARGYNTAFIGKYAVEWQEPYRPLNNGFDYYYGIHVNGTNYFNAFVWRRDKPAGQVLGNLTVALATDAVDYINRTAPTGQPFFLDFQPTAAHEPYQATPDQLQRCSKLSGDRQGYCSVFVGLDDAVGRIVQALKDKGVYENTMIFFAGDNGFEGEAGASSPFRGEKGTPYEAGVRVPFTWTWPGVIPAGSTFAPPVSLMDIYATIAQGGDVTEPTWERPVDSVNLLPYVTGQATGPVHNALFFATRPTEGSVRQGDFKLYRFKNERVELYNLAKDPGETMDIAGKSPNVVARMRPLLEDWLNDLQPNPVY